MEALSKHNDNLEKRMEQNIEDIKVEVEDRENFEEKAWTWLRKLKDDLHTNKIQLEDKEYKEDMLEKKVGEMGKELEKVKSSVSKQSEALAVNKVETTWFVEKIQASEKRTKDMALKILEVEKDGMKWKKEIEASIG